jgi:hypothetical protein
MTDLPSLLAGLRRPRLLIRAARFGLCDYRRTPGLRRMFAAAGARTPAQIVATLIVREAELDQRRRAGDTAYCVARHVEVLIALMAEARQLPPQPPQAKASGIAALRAATKPASASAMPASSVGAS